MRPGLDRGNCAHPAYIPRRAIRDYQVIMAQALLAQMGAESVRSVIVARYRDSAIEAALASTPTLRYSTHEVLGTGLKA